MSLVFAITGCNNPGHGHDSLDFEQREFAASSLLVGTNMKMAALFTGGEGPDSHVDLKKELIAIFKKIIEEYPRTRASKEAIKYLKLIDKK